MLDTNVAIHFRDGNVEVIDRVVALRPDAVLSVVTRVELESGVYVDRSDIAARRLRLDSILAVMTVLPFGDAESAAYGAIIQQTGFSRSRVLDRMIAAQAIAHDATLVTMNGDDFRGIDRLQLEVWPAMSA